ncbi:family 43 glycosylhydrolase [Muricauda sp. MAR_2010_75]|uniref:glycoside hydrolase family 43 protein n=1 Tax=Allomuricauda sp. MAR_2010_75 TaxID=1250232 RepID=UPI0012E05DB4|nr:glycoside hydrolase family 43 protein [Muricauda sp. MAR_2010_75]
MKSLKNILVYMISIFFFQMGIGQDKNTFTNPILEDGADPYTMLHDNGYYYFMVTRGNRLELWSTKDLTQVKTVGSKTVWKAPSEGENSCCIWAPEIHHVDGKWYIYYTAADASNEGDHSRYVFVLENSHQDPMQGEWIDRGKINTKYCGIDGSIFKYGDKRYFMYSPYVDDHSDIAIATMSNPWTLNDDETILAAPKYDWEKTGERSILEGPSFLEGPGDEVFIVYSAGACWDDNYSLGMLAAKKDSDFTKASSWKRFSKAVFEFSTENNVYGPGHHSITTSNDPSEHWLVYHAKDKPKLGCSQRSTRIQRFGWDKEGRPDFGEPWPLEKVIKKPK